MPGSDSVITVEPPEAILRPSLLQRWSRLAFLHWPFEPDQVQRLLPPGLTVDTLDGQAWVGLIGFHMTIRPAWSPPMPWLSRFPEINVRTYVRGARGEGIWFFSLDISRLLPVVVARSFYGVPYMWGRMGVESSGASLRYWGTRGWPAPSAAADLRVEIGPPYKAAELGDLDHFLTARWGLYAVLGGKLRYIPVDHPRWPLHRATVMGVKQDLVQATGLPVPRGEPLVHFSPGVDVRFGSMRSVD